MEIAMKRMFCGALSATGAMGIMLPALAATMAADGTEWKKRCMRELGRSNDPETGKYFFSTPGMAEGALGRAQMDYSVTGSRTAAIYPTAEKDFMSQWNGATFNIGYYADFATKAPHDATLRVGQVSALVSAKNGIALQGPITIKLVIDGKTFGPYEPNATSLSSGLYSVWFDTAETDGDSKPPRLKPAQFAKLAKAAEAMKTAEMVLMRDKTDVVRLPVAISKRDGWVNEFKPWASSARGFVKKSGGCPNALETNW